MPPFPRLCSIIAHTRRALRNGARRCLGATIYGAAVAWSLGAAIVYTGVAWVVALIVMGFTALLAGLALLWSEEA